MPTRVNASAEMDLGKIAALFRETSQSQAQLLQNSIDEVRDVLELLKTSQQTHNDLLQILTNQSEMAEKQSQRLVAVTHALIQATTALRELPPGSARVYAQAPEE